MLAMGCPEQRGEGRGFLWEWEVGYGNSIALGERKGYRSDASLGGQLLEGQLLEAHSNEGKERVSMGRFLGRLALGSPWQREEGRGALGRFLERLAVGSP